MDLMTCSFFEFGSERGTVTLHLLLRPIYRDRSTATDSLNPTVTCLLGIGLRFGIGLLLLLLLLLL
eukprot:scaffold8687_cov92-Amphora_coffeaeformis.AAC.1